MVYCLLWKLTFMLHNYYTSALNIFQFFLAHPIKTSDKFSDDFVSFKAPFFVGNLNPCL